MVIKKKNKSNSKIIIFGSKGFIASNLIKQLKNNKLNFLVISKDKIDLTNSDDVKKLSKIINTNDTIVFISAIAPVKDYNSFSKNIQMACNFLNYINKNYIGHFIYISSDAVYSDSSKALNEKSITNPDNLHGQMHITREKLFTNIFKNITIVRPTLIYGKDDPHNGYGPNSFYRLLKNKKNIKLFGKGEELRDHVHIKNVCESIFKIIKYEKTGIFNLCSGNVISFYDIAQILIEETNSKSKILFSKRNGSMPHNGYRPLSNKLIKKELNQKFLNLKNGIKVY